MHQEIASPSFSSRNFFHMPNSFRRTGGRHCSCQVSEIQCFGFSGIVIFFRTSASISPVHALAPCSLLPLLIQCAAWLFGRSRASVATCHSTPAPPAVAEPLVEASRGQPCSTAPPSTAHTTRSLRVAVLFSVHAVELLSWPKRRRGRSLPPTSP